MFCTQCGTQNPEGVNTCTNCGATLGAETNETAAKKPGFDPVALFHQFRASKYFIPGVAGGAGLILVIVLLIVLLGGGKTKPIDRVLSGIVKADAEKFVSAYPDDYIEYMEDENDFDIDDIEDYLDELLEEMEDDIGDKIKFSYEVTKEKKLSDKKLDDLKERLNSYYGLAKRDLTEAWEIKIDVTFSGSDDDEDGELEFIIIKYDGKWYVSPTTDLF